MSEDSEKIIRVKEFLQTQDLSRIFEIIGLVLSIKDDEDRDLALFDVTGWLIQNGLWQKAYGASQLISESYEKNESLILVANYLSSIGHLEKSFFVFDEAINVSLSGNLADWQKAELLNKIALSLWQMKAFYKADEVWEKAVSTAQSGEMSDSQNSLDSSSVLAEIAKNFAFQGRIEKSLSIAQKIKNLGKRERVLRQITEYSQNVKQVA